MVRIALKVVIAAAIAVAVIYWFYFKPVPVVSYQVKSVTLDAEVMGTGTLYAPIKTTISSEISGRITKLTVDQNDNVKKGQLLVTLDDGDLRQQVEMATATILSAKSALSRAKADLAKADVVLAQRRIDYTRTKSLFDKQVATNDELDAANEKVNVAEAECSRSKAALSEAEYEIVVTEQTLKYHQERLRDTKILNPFDDGVVVFRYRDVGDVVVPGAAIFDVVCRKELWISAWVDESAMAAVAKNQPVNVVFRSEPQKTYAGRVVRMAHQVDRETREFIVDVLVEELPVNWAVGQRAEVYIRTGRRENVLAIPQRMVMWKDGKAMVFVDESGHTRMQPVTLGIRGRDMVEVLSGLKDGQLVISPKNGDVAKLRDGRAISR